MFGGCCSIQSRATAAPSGSVAGSRSSASSVSRLRVAGGRDESAAGVGQSPRAPGARRAERPRAAGVTTSRPADRGTGSGRTLKISAVSISAISRFRISAQSTCSTSRNATAAATGDDGRRAAAIGSTGRRTAPTSNGQRGVGRVDRAGAAGLAIPTTSAPSRRRTGWPRRRRQRPRMRATGSTNRRTNSVMATAISPTARAYSHSKARRRVAAIDVARLATTNTARARRDVECQRPRDGGHPGGPATRNVGSQRRHSDVQQPHRHGRWRDTRRRAAAVRSLSAGRSSRGKRALR